MVLEKGGYVADHMDRLCKMIIVGGINVCCTCMHFECQIMHIDALHFQFLHWKLCHVWTSYCNQVDQYLETN